MLKIENKGPRKKTREKYETLWYKKYENVKNTNTQFTKPDTKIALKHKKRCSNSLIEKGTFLKIEIPFLSSIRLVKINMYVSHYILLVKLCTFIHCWWEAR